MARTRHLRTANAASQEGSRGRRGLGRPLDGMDAQQKQRGRDARRWGVTAVYLFSGREVEIKMAQGAKPGEIAGMLYREAGLPDGAIGKIALFPRHSLIDIRSEFAEAAIESTRKAKLRGRPFKLAHDRK